MRLAALVIRSPQNEFKVSHLKRKHWLLSPRIPYPDAPVPPPRRDLRRPESKLLPPDARHAIDDGCVGLHVIHWL